MIKLAPMEALNHKAQSGQLYGMAPLHIVADGRDKEDKRDVVIATLASAKADLEVRDLNGRTPLLVAAGSGYFKGAQQLYKSGADMTATKDNGWNFADAAKGCNSALAAWWSAITRLSASGAASDHRPDMWRRTGMSDKRYERVVQDREWRRARDQAYRQARDRAQRPKIARDAGWGSDSWRGGGGGRDWSEAGETAERGSYHQPLMHVDPYWMDHRHWCTHSGWTPDMCPTGDEWLCGVWNGKG